MALAMQGLGLGIAGLSRAELSQVAESRGSLRIFWAQGFFQDGQRLTVERLGLCITTFIPWTSARLFKLRPTSGCWGAKP